MDVHGLIFHIRFDTAIDRLWVFGSRRPIHGLMDSHITWVKDGLPLPVNDTRRMVLPNGSLYIIICLQHINYNLFSKNFIVRHNLSLDLFRDLVELAVDLGAARLKKLNASKKASHTSAYTELLQSIRNDGMSGEINTILFKHYFKFSILVMLHVTV